MRIFCVLRRNSDIPYEATDGRQRYAQRGRTLKAASVVFFIAVSAFWNHVEAQTKGTCPLPVGTQFPPNPPNPALSLADNKTGRRQITGDYLVIEYDAYAHTTFWYDYHHTYDPSKRDEYAYNIDRNAGFLPVVYTREKIAIHVCNLHFNDQLTVTTAPLPTPEGGADIRGATSTAPLTSLTSTFDALQTTASTGGMTPEAGLGFSTPGTLGTITVNGVTPTSLSTADSKLTFTNATVTVSGAQVAQYFVAFQRSAENLWQNIRATRAHPAAPPNLFPGSIDSILAQLKAIQAKVDGETSQLQPLMASSADPNHLPTAALAEASNFAAFDEDVTAVQGLSAQLNSLAGALTTQAFGARAVALQNNYAVLRGVLDFAEQGLAQNNCKPRPPTPGGSPNAPIKVSPLLGSQIGAMTPKDFSKLSPSELLQLTAAQVQGITGAQLGSLNKDQRDALLRPRDVSPQPGEDQPSCSQFEYQKFAIFISSFNQELDKLTYIDNSAIDHATFLKNAAKTRMVMWDEISRLREEINDIDESTGKLFNTMNGWYAQSVVEQTDLLAPQNNNTVMRLAIEVQRGYTPFTLTANPTAVASTTTAVTTPTSSASTSTPPHAVKTILVEVHRLANFNLAGGVMTIHVPTATYSVVAGTPPSPSMNTTGALFPLVCNGVTSQVPGTPTVTMTGTSYTAPAYACITPTQTTSWQVVGMVGVTWYPFGRDYFPRRSGYANYRRNYIPGLLVGTSVTSLGTGFGALSFEPFSGIGFLAGIGSAHRTVPPQGTSPNAPVASNYALPSPAPTQLHVGLSLGIDFDLNVFLQLFKTPPTGTMP
jgi:hypothetical protein